MAPLKSQKKAVKKEALKKNMTKPAKKCSPLSVAITCDQTGILSEVESKRILTAIQKQIISEANSTKLDTSRPSFNAQPLYEEGVLKLWCDNDHTLEWLKNTVSGLNLPGSSPVVKSQLEIKKLVSCRFYVPDKQEVFEKPEDIGRAVSYQNTWVNVGSWALINAEQSDSGTWSVEVDVPEDQIPTLLKAGRRLSIGLTAVHIFFEGPGGIFNSDIPRGWDPATETIDKQPRKPKTVRPSTVVPFVIASDAQLL